MKKFYMLMTAFVLGFLGLYAQNITQEEAWSDPESGPMDFETMFEYVDSYSGGPVVSWGANLPLYYNTDSDYYLLWDYDGPCVSVELNINGKYYGDVPGIIDNYEEGGIVMAGQLNILLGEYLEYILEDIEYNTIQENFTMELKIYEGSLFVGMDNGDVNDDFVITYTFGEGGESGVVPEGYLPDPSFDIDDNTLFICWNQEIKIANGTNFVTAQMYYPGSAGNTTTVQLMGPTTWIPGSVEGDSSSYNDNALLIDLSSYVAEYGAGIYQIMILQEGVITSADGKLVNDWVNTGSFTLSAIMEPIAETSLELSDESITIVYGGYEVNLNPNNEADIIVFETVGENKEIRPTAEDITINGSTVNIDISSLEISEGSSYYYIIPEGYFIVGDSVNAGIEGEYKFSSISAIMSGSVDAPVYNLQGVKVGNNVNGLSNGIYIINGKKVVIRK